MDMEMLNQVVEGMRRALEPAQRVLNRIYNWDMRKMFDQVPDQNDQDRNELESNLAGELMLAADRHATFLELLGLTATRGKFIKGWEDLAPDCGHTDWWHNDEDDGLESKAMDYLNETYRSLSLLKPDNDLPHQPKDDPLLSQLEYALRATANVLRNRGITPNREQEIKTIMHEHLETVFADYARNVKIAKPIAGFEPDGGVPSLKAAIEFKFCASEADLKEAMRGVTEDLSGYAGSSDWTKFYSVVYQTEAFTTEDRFQCTLRLSGNSDAWTHIVVTGGANSGKA